jgi:ketosteroid isomerase-like protein
MGGVDLDRFSAAYWRNTEALHRGDPAAAFAWIGPDFEWHVLADSLPADVRPETPPVLRGREAVIAYFEQLIEDWDWRPEPREFVEPGDGTVMVRAEGVITGRATGLRGRVQYTQTWEFGLDGLPARVRERLDSYSLEPPEPN